MQYTGQLPWDPITLDVYPRAATIQQTLLYEDDTLTTAYQRGQFRKTSVSVSADSTNRTVQVTIGAAAGSFQGARKRRGWVLRIHRPSDWPENLAPVRSTINGRQIRSPFRRIARDNTAMPFGDPSGAPDADIWELTLPVAAVKAERQLKITFAPIR